MCIFNLYLCIYGGRFTCLFIFLAMEFSWKCFSGAIWNNNCYLGEVICPVAVHKTSSQPWTGWGVFSLLFFPCCFVCSQTAQLIQNQVLARLFFFKPFKSLCVIWRLTLPPEMFLLKSAPRYSCAYTAFFFPPNSIPSLPWRKAAVLNCKILLISRKSG